MRGERLSQRVSAVAPLGEALDGTPVKKQRAARKAAPKPIVGTTFVCHCGERFDDLREAWIHIRAEYTELRRIFGNLRRSNGYRLIAECGTHAGYGRHKRLGEPICDPCQEAENANKRAYHKRNRDKILARQRQYWLDNAERLRALKRQQDRERAANPAWREKRNAQERERRARRKAESQQGTP